MRYGLFGSLIAAALTAAAPAAALDQPPPSTAPEIVVTGTRDMDRQLRDFVGALTQTPEGGLLSRFERAICPTAVGVSPTQKEAIVTRMKKVAEAAGIIVGGADCTPNVLLVVTSDKAAFIDALSKRHGYYFSGMSKAEVRRLARGPGPAAAWHVDGPTRNADGVELQPDGPGVPVNRTMRAASRMTEAARPQFAAAAVVVETKALDGLTTIQLADYAAMRAFSRADPTKLAGSEPTILNVLEAPMGAAVPITMTQWDIGFLRSLYDAPMNISASAQRSAISRGLKEELEEPEGEK